MSSEIAAPKRKLLLLKIGAVVVVLAVVAVLLLRGVDLRGWLDRAMTMIRDAGPAVFFISMALLPAIGMPVMPFNLLAGSAFGERLGMPMVVFLALAALTVNLILCYALARRWLRPLLEWLMKRLGYSLPKMESGDLTDLTIILRVTPGTPFFIQNYLLGLAGVPVGKYLLVSCTVLWFYTAAFVVFGDALLQGKGKNALFGLSILVAAVVLTHWARKHYGKKKTSRESRE
jgi:uncharacterized membrane protein YdjX (TVP38/TMEM64 family)